MHHNIELVMRYFLSITTQNWVAARVHGHSFFSNLKEEQSLSLESKLRLFLQCAFDTSA